MNHLDTIYEEEYRRLKNELHKKLQERLSIERRIEKEGATLWLLNSLQEVNDEIIEINLQLGL